MNLRNKRRATVSVRVGNTTIGGDAPVRIQSMTTTPTLDTEASVAQARRIAEAGGELVRLTAQGVNHAANLAAIKAALVAQGIEVPLVADIHFNPAAAFEAARHVEKVRINPGNFFDPGRTFKKMEFTDEEYNSELARLRDKLLPFLELCRQCDTAIRIGVNHGSLSDRIMSRYGDGPEGMVESAMEFLRICRSVEFDRVVISIKASDVPTMTSTVRRLVEAMDAEDMHYPLHLGVTEAGNASEGRVKSAVGIGSLLADGIGDTIRVSLSEVPEAEIPVARSILSHIAAMYADPTPMPPFSPARRSAHVPAIIHSADEAAGMTVAEASDGNRVARILNRNIEGSVAVHLKYPAGLKGDDLTVAAAIDFGYLLLAGRCDALWLDTPELDNGQANELCRLIIQAAGIARFKAEIVACPGCGRTLYDLPETLEKVKSACSHLRHLKIAVMGCIVNGPGEMAGADYGYVGAAAGNVSIYRGIEPVYRNIPQNEALGKLIELIKADGQWIEPEHE